MMDSCSIIIIIVASVKDERSFRLYPLPIFVLADKDKSKFRERLVTVLRVP